MPLVWETYSYHKHSVDNYEQFKQGNLSGLSDQYLFYFRSPFVFSPSFLMYPFFGTSEDVAAFQGTIFLVILIIATYLLGKELFNRDVGLLTATIVSFSPYLLAFSKTVFEDIAFVAMFTLILYFFVKSKKFSDIRYIWLFNISLGLTLLSRFNAFIILLFIIITYVILKLLFDRKDFKNYFLKSNRRNIAHFMASFFVSMILPLFFYLRSKAAFLCIYYPPNIQGISFLLIYIPKALVSYLKTIPINFEYFIFFIISFIFFLFFSKKNKLFIISLIIGANLYTLVVLYMYTIPADTISRYMLFMKTIYVLIISLFIYEFFYNLRSKVFRKSKIRFLSKIKYVFLITLLLLVILVPLTVFFNYNPKLKGPIPLSSTFGKYHPSKIEYNNEELLSDLLAVSKKENITVLVYFPLNSFTTDLNSLASFNYENRIEIINVFFASDVLEFRGSFNRPIDKSYFAENNFFYVKRLSELDFIIMEPEQSRSNSAEFDSYHKQIISHIQDNSNNFEILKKIAVDDFNTTLYVYKTKK